MITYTKSPDTSLSFPSCKGARLVTPAVTDPIDIFLLSTRSVLNHSLRAKLTKYEEDYRSALDIFSIISRYKSCGYLVHFINPSIYSAYRDHKIVTAGLAAIYYNIQVRELGDFKILILHRDPKTAPTKALQEYAADTWPVNNKIINTLYSRKYKS